MLLVNDLFFRSRLPLELIQEVPARERIIAIRMIRVLDMVVFNLGQ